MVAFQTRMAGPIQTWKEWTSDARNVTSPLLIQKHKLLKEKKSVVIALTRTTLNPQMNSTFQRQATFSAANIKTKEACLWKLGVIALLLSCAALSAFGHNTESTTSVVSEHTGNAFGVNMNLASGVESRHATTNGDLASQNEISSSVSGEDRKAKSENNASPSQHILSSESAYSQGGGVTVSNEPNDIPKGENSPPAQFISNVACPERLLTPVESISKERIVIHLGIEYEQVPYCNSLFILPDLPLHLSPIQRARNLIIP